MKSSASSTQCTIDRILKTPQNSKGSKVTKRRSVDPSSTLLSPPPSRQASGQDSARFYYYADDFLSTPSKPQKLEPPFQEKRSALSLITINGRAHVSSNMKPVVTNDEEDEEDYYYKPDDARLAMHRAVSRSSPQPSYELYNPPKTPPRSSFFAESTTTPSKLLASDAALFSSYTVIGMSPYGF